MRGIRIDRLYETDEASALVEVSREHISRLCRQGDLAGAHKDERGRWLIPGAALAGWLVQHLPCARAPSRWLTCEAMARYCDLEWSTLARWCKEHQVPPMPDGSPGARIGRVPGSRRLGWFVHGDALRYVVSFRGRTMDREIEREVQRG